MKPENIETYNTLKQHAEETTQALNELCEVKPPDEVENLSPSERIERLTGLIKHMVVRPVEERSTFGAKDIYRGTTPRRIVQTPTGEEYMVTLTVHSRKRGYRQQEFVSFSSEWFKRVPGSTYYVENYNEYMDNGWVQHDPDLPRGHMLLSNLEWSLDTYLNGTAIEDIPDEN